MSKKRRQFSNKFKARVALEALRGLKTISELSSEYKVHPTQISAWKRHLASGAADLFEGPASQRGKTEEELTAPLYEEIGRLKMDIKWLEKKL